MRKVWSENDDFSAQPALEFEEEPVIENGLEMDPDEGEAPLPEAAPKKPSLCATLRSAAAVWTGTKKTSALYRLPMA